MDIKISLEREEVKEIIKVFVLKELPVNIENKDIYVGENYGEYTVEITEKTKPEEKAEEVEK